MHKEIHQRNDDREEGLCSDHAYLDHRDGDRESEQEWIQVLENRACRG